MTTQFQRPGMARAAASDDLVSTAKDVKDKLAETMDQAQAVAQEQYDKLAHSIRRNPLQAAGIAAGVGFVLALLARR